AIAIPGTILTLTKYIMMRGVTLSKGKGTAASLKSKHRALPASLPFSQETIGSYERIESKTFSFDAFGLKTTASDSDLQLLLTKYERANMLTFLKTPQASIIKSASWNTEDAVKKSFDVEHIQALDFKAGDRVNGVYIVTYRSVSSNDNDKRLYWVELKGDAPSGFKGDPHLANIMIVGGIQINKESNELLFYNETWAWREPGDRSTILESWVGAWMHEWFCAWLVKKGIDAVLT
ncbi:UNVERIFIED_CONTAM: hypothetical protein HDU68_005449, partial [Siphonaria sp. JEL0065]